MKNKTNFTTGYAGSNARARKIQARLNATKQKKRDIIWNYTAVAVIAFMLGGWAGVALTNGTW
jgi:glycerol uptake facilitator-like aquaporin